LDEKFQGNRKGLSTQSVIPEENLEKSIYLDVTEQLSPQKEHRETKTERNSTHAA
jgi:hypothetical protein